MVDFNELKDKAQDLVAQHADQPLRTRNPTHVRHRPDTRAEWVVGQRAERRAAKQAAHVGWRQRRPSRHARHRLQRRGGTGDDRGSA